MDAEVSAGYIILWLSIGALAGVLLSNIDRIINKVNNQINVAKPNQGNPEIEAMNREIDKLCIKRGIHGCSVAAYINSDLVYHHDNIGEGKSIMRIASITKSVTAVAMAKLIEDKQYDPEWNIDFDSTIHDVIKHNSTMLAEFENYTTLRQYMRIITIAQLLSNRSGFRHYESLTEYLRHSDESLQMFGDDPLLFEPGKGYKYSSFGFYILGLLIECMSGQNYYDYVKEHIFDPLGMKDSGSMLSIPGPYRKQYVRECKTVDRGYKETVICDLNDSYSSAYFDEVVYYKHSAGGLLSTASDIARFGSSVVLNQWLSAYAQKNMFVGHSMLDNDDYYGFGWHMDKKKDANVIWHTGGAVGGASYLKVVRDCNFSICVICDTQYEKGTITHEIAEIVQNHFF